MSGDDVIDGYLSTLLGRSEPGDSIHHLLVAAAKPGDRTAFGLVDLDKLKVNIYALAPDESVGLSDFIAKAVAAAAMEAHKDGMSIYFAGLAIEAHVVSLAGNDEVAENRARRLSADRRLREHPEAVEMTRLYAACKDGRRWVGQHHLTGPQAGTITGPDLRVGPLLNDEWELPARLVRNLVRLTA